MVCDDYVPQSLSLRKLVFGLDSDARCCSTVGTTSCQSPHSHWSTSLNSQATSHFIICYLSHIECLVDYLRFCAFSLRSVRHSSSAVSWRHQILRDMVRPFGARLDDDGDDHDDDDYDDFYFCLLLCLSYYFIIVVILGDPHKPHRVFRRLVALTSSKEFAFDIK